METFLVIFINRYAHRNADELKKPTDSNHFPDENQVVILYEQQHSYII